MSRAGQTGDRPEDAEELTTGSSIKPGAISTFCFFWIVGTAFGPWTAGQWWTAIAAGAAALAAGLAVWRSGRASSRTVPAEPSPNTAATSPDRRAWLTRRAFAQGLAGLAVVLAAMFWYSTFGHRLPADHIAFEIDQQPRLVRVVGRLDTPRSVQAPPGEWTPTYQPPPVTLGRIRLEAVDVGQGLRPATGSLHLRIKEEEHRLEHGMRVEAMGMLEAISRPDAPGLPDFRQILSQQGIWGRLILETRGNVQVLDEPDWVGRLWQARYRFSLRCQEALLLGLDEEARSSEFLVAILLGRPTASRPELHEEFRQVGLAHLLAISGAHLGILLGLIWLVARLAVDRPTRAAVLVLLVLMFYLAAVPLRTPIIRAGVMGAMVCLGLAMGRRISSIDMISAAAMLILLFQPQALANPGFQLSFGIVFGLLLFTARVSRWFYVEPLFDDGPPSELPRIKRRIADFFAANLVAWTISVPIIAHHFQAFNPLTMPLMVPAFILLTAALGLGFLKLLIGLVLPSVGVLFAYPVAWAGEAMLMLTGRASELRWSMIELPSPPPLAWMLISVGALAWIYGARASRAWPAMIVLVGCALWPIVDSRPISLLDVPVGPQAPVRIVQIPLGERQATLVRLWDDDHRRERTILLNPGSAWQSHSGFRSLHPVLMRLGVRQIDDMVLTQPRLGHFNAALELAATRHIGRVIVPAGFFDDADLSPNTRRALERLQDTLEDLGVPIVTADPGLDLAWHGFAVRYQSTPHTGAARDGPSLGFSLTHHGQPVLALASSAPSRTVRAWLDELSLFTLPERTWIVDRPMRVDLRTQMRWINQADPTIILGAAPPDLTPPAQNNDENSGPTALRQWLDTNQRGMIEIHYHGPDDIRWSGFIDPE